MTTKRQIIKLGYSSVGLAGFIYDLTPEQIELARQLLDAQMASWNAKGIRISWPIPSSPEQGDIDEEIDLPDYALSAAYMALGEQLADVHGKQVTPKYSARARAAYDAMLIRVVEPATRQMPAGYPLGAGYKTNGIGQRWTTGPDPSLSTGNDELEL